MNWFSQLKAALPAYYLHSGPPRIVGYLKGSGDPAVWRQMERSQNRNQMIILGNTEPDDEDWVAAGVLDRGATKVISIDTLAGFIVLYGGFVRRPWGKIFIADHDARAIGFPAALSSWRRNTPRR